MPKQEKIVSALETTNLPNELWFSLPLKCRANIEAVLKNIENSFPPYPLTPLDLPWAIRSVKSPIKNFLEAIKPFRQQTYSLAWNQLLEKSIQETEACGRLEIRKLLQNKTFEMLEMMTIKSIEFASEEKPKGKISLPLEFFGFATESVTWASLADRQGFEVNIPFYLLDLLKSGVLNFQFFQFKNQEKGLVHFLYKNEGEIKPLGLIFDLPS